MEELGIQHLARSAILVQTSPADLELHLGFHCMHVSSTADLAIFSTTGSPVIARYTRLHPYTSLKAIRLPPDATRRPPFKGGSEGNGG
jgi:hypothetical protein